jgi:ribosomal protein S14
MIKISEPTQQDYDRGYQVCPCGDGVCLLQAGFEVDLTLCPQCMREVADIDDFKTADGVDILSK